MSGKIVAISACAGFVIGTGVGYLIANRLIEEEVEEKLYEQERHIVDRMATEYSLVLEAEDEELQVKIYNSMIDAYLGKKRILALDEQTQVDEQYGKELVRTLTDINEFEEGDQMREDPRDSALDWEYEGGEDDDWDDSLIAVEDSDQVDKPIMVDPNDYYSDFEDYDKVTMYFYKEDGVFCTDDDTKLTHTDVVECIGEAGIDSISSQAINTIYIRNHPKESDFVVYAQQGSYGGEVAAKAETDSEREKRRNTRKKNAEK